MNEDDYKGQLEHYVKMQGIVTNMRIRDNNGDSEALDSVIEQWTIARHNEFGKCDDENLPRKKKKAKQLELKDQLRIAFQERNKLQIQLKALKKKHEQVLKVRAELSQQLQATSDDYRAERRKNVESEVEFNRLTLELGKYKNAEENSNDSLIVKRINAVLDQELGQDPVPVAVPEKKDKKIHLIDVSSGNIGTVLRLLHDNFPPLLQGGASIAVGVPAKSLVSSTKQIGVYLLDPSNSHYEDVLEFASSISITDGVPSISGPGIDISRAPVNRDQEPEDDDIPF